MSPKVGAAVARNNRLVAQLACLRRLRIEQENVRAALEWAPTSSTLAEKGVELAGALFWFWTKRGLYEEGQLWLEQALAVVHAARGLRARALIGLAHMHTFRGRHVEVAALATEALSLGREEGDAWVVSFALSRRRRRRAACPPAPDPWQHRRLERRPRSSAAAL